MSLDDELIVKPLTHSKAKRKWLGTWPETCSNCGCDLQTTSKFYDARHKLFGWWGLFCHTCWTTECAKPLGIGNGQCYDSKTLEKIGG